MDQIKAKANYTRVCQLLIDKGGIALRGALHKLLAPSTLAAALNANKATLQKMRKRVIKDPQWDLLFPASGSPDSNNFDITLLTILLRNISGLLSPTKGWDVMPPASDTSISADIARIKVLRNEIYGHTARPEYDDITFAKYWQDISTPLIMLGIPRNDIDELKVAPLSPEEESHIEKLKEWKEVEDELLSRFDDVEKELLNLRRAVESASTSQIKQLAKFDFTPRINDLCKKFLHGTRQWFFDELSSWFNDDESRVMILTAGPGIGKSVLFAKICEMYKQYGELAACHFCDFKKSDYSNPRRILQSLASQMCENIDGFREKLNEVLKREHSRESLSDAFRVLLEDPLHGLNRTEPTLLVIDALDESKTEVRNEFLELIAEEFEKLPTWIKILISSRPELQVKKKLEFLNPLEILPDDEHHQEDLKHFIKSSLPNIFEYTLLWKCEGSFLYAYYLVNELKQGGQEFEPIRHDYICKGIAGFYHKQFTRLKTGLQRCKPNAWSSILKIFRNTIAASKEPLPCKILFTCMDLSSEYFEIREMIIGIMSELLPIYENCLTVYHKSLYDWLTLNGYEEHAFVADVEDGKYRLWRVCENVYRDIVSFRSISNFEISPEARYALKSGHEFLFDVGGAEDFHWLVNVRLNFLRLQVGGTFDFDNIFRFYKSKHSNYHCWGNIHMLAFSNIFNASVDPFDEFTYSFSATPEWPYVFLRSLVNGYFDFVQKAISGKNEAREILDEKNKVWLEEIGNEYIPKSKIISHAIILYRDPDNNFKFVFDASAVSPDNKLIAHKMGTELQVFDLPNLRWVFSLKVKDSQEISEFLQFSPDSSYLVWNSARSCLSLTKQMEVPLIPHGPENVECVSISPCGMRLVTCEKNYIKLWNVKSKDQLVKIKTDLEIKYSIFSDCNSYIFATIVPQIGEKFDFNHVAIFNSTTLERSNNDQICCPKRCLTKEDTYQIISPPLFVKWRLSNDDANPRLCHFHCPTTARIVVTSNKFCSNPFEWKGKKCFIFLTSNHSRLVFYDFINQEVVDVFHNDDIPTCSWLRCVSKLDARTVLGCSSDISSTQAFVLSLEASTESCKREARLSCASDIKCCALSPDESYIACCSEGLILTIVNINNGKTLQTVELKHPPEACWWSEFYFWVICNGMVVKYSYNLIETKVLGNEIEECSINFVSVVVFMNSVLVIRPSNKTGICMLKICDKKLYSQQIPDSNFTASSGSVSSDGCAVFLYSESSKDYELWEIADEHRWKSRSSGRFDIYDLVDCFCLIGTKIFMVECRRYTSSLVLFSIDLVTGKKVCIWKQFLNWDLGLPHVTYVNSKTIILHNGEWIIFISMVNLKIITSLIAPSLLYNDYSVASFFIPSRGLLLSGGKRSIKIFRIRNIEKFLPDLIEN